MLKINFKARNKQHLEHAFIFSLVLFILIFYAFKEFDIKTEIKSYEPPIIIIDEIPAIELEKRPAPPDRPKIPVESELDEFPDEVTIQPTDFAHITRLTDIPQPPDPTDDPVVPFAMLSEKPQIIFKGKPVYPELAIKAGIQGTVYVTVTIGKTGLVEKVELLKSVPMLDEAALAAAKKCRFKPAKQRDKFVRVRISLPFKFELR
jgi:protein TonB